MKLGTKFCYHVGVSNRFTNHKLSVFRTGTPSGPPPFVITPEEFMGKKWNHNMKSMMRTDYHLYCVSGGLLLIAGWPQSLVDTACAPRHSGTGAVFSENFVSFKPGHDIHWEVAPDLLKQKTKTNILKDEQEPGTAVLCNGSNWESEVGRAQWAQVEYIVRVSIRNTIKGLKCTVRRKRISDMRPGTWHCLITPHPSPDIYVILFM